MNDESAGEVKLYRSRDGSVSLEVRTGSDTVWMTRQQMAELFGRDVKTIGKHIGNARIEELADISTVAKFATVQHEGDRVVERKVEHFNLDMVLSVGYRVKSAEGIHFRRWASDVLTRYVVDGVALDQQRLEQVGSIVRILARSSDELIAGVADVLAGYLPSFQLLRDYDAGQLDAGPGSKPGWTLTIDEARSVIAEVRAGFTEDNLFGYERGQALEGVIASIYQGFTGQELYPTVQLKAANLLYLVIKDHPLSDGNKRSAAALFVTFLSRNGILLDSDGLPRISNNALAAVTLLVAMSDPKEKELMVALVVRMLSEPAR